MSRFTKSAIVLAGAFWVFPTAAYANMSYSPWVHEIVQNGADMEVTISVFDEAGETESYGVSLPEFDKPYTLERLSHEESLVIFENRIFIPEEAEEVSDYTCHSWWTDYYDASCDGSQDCVDCDGDGVAECGGFCAVAYRYTVEDVCPPVDSDLLYMMYASPTSDSGDDGEGLGHIIVWAEDVGAACQDEDSGCSVSGVSRTKKTPSFFSLVIEIMIETFID